MMDKSNASIDRIEEKTLVIITDDGITITAPINSCNLPKEGDRLIVTDIIATKIKYTNSGADTAAAKKRMSKIAKDLWE